MIYSKTFFIKTKRIDAVDITEDINKSIKGKEGIVLVFAKHTTAGLTILENYDPSIPEDLHNLLSSLIPYGKWKHDRIDGNGDAHLKSSIIKPSLTLPITNGKLDLGTWQKIVLLEFDGPREREIVLKFIDDYGE